MIEEYDVTFAVKEWLLKHGWNVVAFNPPGSQGTFTIPNPSKDPKYRGQTGSESPDIIAVKNEKYILLVEAKPTYNETDVKKLVNLAENKERLNLLISILEKACNANDVPFKKPVEVILAKAHGGQNSLILDMQTFLVTTDGKWNPRVIDPRIDPFQHMKVIVKSSNKITGELLSG